MGLKTILLLCLLLLNVHQLLGVERFKRFLIFPPSAPTRHQFIAGIGIPAELEDQSVTTGYVFKAQYYLPSNSSIFRESPVITIRKRRAQNKNKYDLKQFRWNSYTFIENIITKLGFNGKQCMLYIICESVNLLKKDELLLTEILKIFLKPSTTEEAFDNKSNVYLAAENIGKSKDNCKNQFFDCEISFIDKISIEV